MCGRITLRKVEEKLEQWNKQNLSTHFFANEFKGELQRLIKLAAEGMLIV